MLIFKRLILALAGLFVLATLYVMLTAPGGTVVDEGSVDLASQDVIQRGEYLATAGNCGSCHTARGGVYHYHALLVNCLTADDVPGEPSPIIGYAFDGYPIYGPMGCVNADCSEVVEFRSCFAVRLQ